MSKYDALLFPAETFHRIGPFRFPVLATLLPGEARALDALNRRQATSVYSTMRLAKKIANAKNITPTEALEALSGGTSGEGGELIIEYIEEFEALNDSALSPVDVLEERVTTVLQYRGEVRLGEGEEGEWVKTADWSEEDTKRIPISMQASISDFIEAEKAGKPVNTLEAGKSPESKVVVTKRRSI